MNQPTGYERKHTKLATAQTQSTIQCVGNKNHEDTSNTYTQENTDQLLTINDQAKQKQ